MLSRWGSENVSGIGYLLSKTEENLCIFMKILITMTLFNNPHAYNLSSIITTYEHNSQIKDCLVL